MDQPQKPSPFREAWDRYAASPDFTEDRAVVGMISPEHDNTVRLLFGRIFASGWAAHVKATEAEWQRRNALVMPIRYQLLWMLGLLAIIVAGTWLMITAQVEWDWDPFNMIHQGSPPLCESPYGDCTTGGDFDG